MDFYFDSLMSETDASNFVKPLMNERFIYYKMLFTNFAHDSIFFTYFAASESNWIDFFQFNCASRFSILCLRDNLLRKINCNNTKFNDDRLSVVRVSHKV